MYIESIPLDGTSGRVNCPAETALARNLKVGLWLVAGVVFGLGGLAATLPMAGAIVAAGEVTVESHVKRIGHPTGGVIADILAHDGDHVRAGQAVMRLDSTVSGANAAMNKENVDQLRARQARLIAERDGLSSIAFPSVLTTRTADPVVAALLTEEAHVFALRRDTKSSEATQLAQRIRQADAEIAGYEAQVQSLKGQSGFIDQELVAARALWEKRYTTLQRLSALERTAVGLRGAEASLHTQQAQTRAKIAEIRQQVIALDQEARSRAGTELSEVESRLNDLQQRKVAADDANERNIIRAPHDGVIDRLAYTTIGGVVPAGVTIMNLVPDGDRLVVRARIRPADIDQVAQGEGAELRFSAFNMRTTPQIKGVVQRVSADLVTDEKSGTGYYTAEIGIAPTELRRLGGLKLRSGMPVEAFVQTGERTMLNYIVKPLADQFQRAFREN